MLIVLAGSAMFCVGGAFMKASQGFTQVLPSLVVAASFMIGAALLSRAVTGHMLSTTLIVGLGFEALGAVVAGEHRVGSGGGANAVEHFRRGPRLSVDEGFAVESE